MFSASFPSSSLLTAKCLLLSNQKIDRSELEDLGMGTKRTLDEYLEYAGVDWTSDPPTLQSRCSMHYDGFQWHMITTKDPS